MPNRTPQPDPAATATWQQNLTVTVLTALAYALAGMLALLLAIPPAYALSLIHI